MSADRSHLALALSAEARLVRHTDPDRAACLFERAVAHASAVESRRLAASILAALAEVRARNTDRSDAVEWVLEQWETREASGVPAETPDVADVDL